MEEWHNIHKGSNVIEDENEGDFEVPESGYDNYLGIAHEVTVTCTDGVITIGKRID